MKRYDGKTPNKAQIAKLLAEYTDKSGLTSFDKYWIAKSNRIADKAIADAAQGPAWRCAPATAKGAIIRRKGNVIPGGKVFI